MNVVWGYLITMFALRVVGEGAYQNENTCKWL